MSMKKYSNPSNSTQFNNQQPIEFQGIFAELFKFGRKLTLNLQR